MRLRDATPLDAGSVGRLLGSFAATQDWMPKLHSGAEDIAHAGQMIARGWVRVAEEDNEIRGFIARNAAEVNALYVAADAQRRGIGARLIADAKDESDRLELWTHQANAPARAFYAAMGFEEVEWTDGAKNEEKLPDVRLTWASSNGKEHGK